jgi:hypothetical protein
MLERDLAGRTASHVLDVPAATDDRVAGMQHSAYSCVPPQ